MNNLKLDNLSIVISSCEKFSDLWDTNISLLNKYWKDRPKDTYIVTDEKTDRTIEGVKIISSGEGKEMPERLRDAMSYINTDYVLLTLDDYFLIKKVENDDFESLLLFMDDNNVDYLRLYDIPKENKKVENEKNLFWVDVSECYGVNLYAGIWRKSFLEKTFSDSKNAWNYEVSLDAVARRENAKCAMSRRHEFVILDVVRKGRVLHKANRYLKKHGYDIGDRPLQSYKTELKLFIIGHGKRMLPKSVHKYAKAVLRRFGFKFFSDQAQNV